jgi:ribonuclease-3
MNDLEKFEKKTGTDFKDKNLLKQALTHRSYINENSFQERGHNERLEFLGDAVLELVITEYLYSQYPRASEGEMTSFRAALVNANMLSEIAKEISLGDFLFLSRGEARDTGRARQYILANAFEALIGALYLDGGYEQAFSFLKKFVFPKLKEVIEKKLWIDAKSLFQEKAQEVLGITPTYRVLSESGPDHDKRFVVGVYLNEKIIAEAEGSSKQEAEEHSARKALKLKHWED